MSGRETVTLLPKGYIFYIIKLNNKKDIALCFVFFNSNGMSENKNLDKETLEIIKKDLLERKNKILTELGEIARKENNSGDDEYKATFPEYGDKPDENAQEIAEYTTNLAEEDMLEKTLRDIDSSLERIEKGTYGICKYCQKQIDPRRLTAQPTAGACIDCKTKLQND
jgi:RNA polymerase-binding protein DksA